MLLGNDYVPHTTATWNKMTHANGRVAFKEDLLLRSNLSYDER